VPVAVVIDSGADLPPDLASSHRIVVIPLLIAFGNESFRDGVDLPPAAFWERLAGRRGRDAVPSTASPPPEAFANAYRRAADGGADAVVSVHLSSELSSTADHARSGAREAGVPVPVQVVDSRLVGVGLGLVALHAARAASDGDGPERVAGAAKDAAGRVELSAALETVELLRRGGRVGPVRAALSDALRIRPVLTMRDGSPELVAKCRTRARALDHLVSRASGPAAAAAVTVGGPASQAGDLADRVAEACGVRPFVSPMGAAIGAHLGPGAIGVAVLRPGETGA
jgi:DegV family protein with EDD domain